MLVVRTAPVPIQFANSSPALGKYTLNNRYCGRYLRYPRYNCTYLRYRIDTVGTTVRYLRHTR